MREYNEPTHRGEGSSSGTTIPTFAILAFSRQKGLERRVNFVKKNNPWFSVVMPTSAFLFIKKSFYHKEGRLTFKFIDSLKTSTIMSKRYPNQHWEHKMWRVQINLHLFYWCQTPASFFHQFFLSKRGSIDFQLHRQLKTSTINVNKIYIHENRWKYANKDFLVQLEIYFTTIDKEIGLEG